MTDITVDGVKYECVRREDLHGYKGKKLTLSRPSVPADNTTREFVTSPFSGAVWVPVGSHIPSGSLWIVKLNYAPNVKFAGKRLTDVWVDVVTGFQFHMDDCTVLSRVE